MTKTKVIEIIKHDENLTIGVFFQSENYWYFKAMKEEGACRIFLQ